MNDLINRQTAIDAVKGRFSMPVDNLIVEVLTALPSAQPEQRWIPVDKDEPDKYGEYFITWITSASKKRFVGIAECEVTDEYDYDKDRFKVRWLLDDYIAKSYSDVKVTAWMPLPKPWKGEKDDV